MPTGRHRTIPEGTHEAPLADVRFDDERLVLLFADGRELSLPLQRYPTLQRATMAQREQWQIIGPNRGIHWPQLDLDLSIEGLLYGLPERIPQPPR